MKRIYYGKDSYTEYFVATGDIEDIRERETLPSPRSDHDCTGRPFTMFFNYAKRPDGQWLIRHHVCFDV